MIDRFSERTGPRRRLAVARFWYEGNAFGPVPADLAAFERREWLRGDDALATAREAATELAAVVAFAQARPDWEVVVLRCASALPAGPIDDAVFDAYLRELRADLAAAAARGGFDAIYLSLHGAAITATRQAPELDIVRLARELMPRATLGASFDLHGNLAPEYAELLDVASVYRTHPHVDMTATAGRVLDGLVRCVEGGLVTRRALVNDGVLLGSFNMRTAAGPMRELEDIARAATTGALLEVAVFGGFPYADTRWTGASVLAVSDAREDGDGAAAAAAARTVDEAIHRLAPAFAVTLPTPRAAIAAAIAHPGEGLVAVTDPADNPLSGGGGDTPPLFRALLDARVAAPCAFASFADPGVVAAARAAGVGGTIDATLGGRRTPHFGAGVPVRASVERLTDGMFRNEGPMEHGMLRRCGATAVLAIADRPSLRVVVTEHVVPADDPAFYALHGIDPSGLRLLCVKAKNHFRAAFAERCAAIIDCDAPGPACLDLSQLPFRHLRQARR